MGSIGYETHIFVCTNERVEGHRRGCCVHRGSEKVRARFKALIAEHGLKGRVRANAAGCLDHCETGVTVVVYPEARWYGGVEVEDVESIFAAHVLGGPPVEDERLMIPDPEEG